MFKRLSFFILTVSLLYTSFGLAVIGDEIYATLGLARGASDDQIRNTFLRLAKEFHPDKNRDKSAREMKAAEERMKEINGAYAILTNKNGARDAYEKEQQERQRAGAGFNDKEQEQNAARRTAALADFWEEFFQANGTMAAVKYLFLMSEFFLFFSSHASDPGLEEAFVIKNFVAVKNYTQAINNATPEKMEESLKAFEAYLQKNLYAGVGTDKLPEFGLMGYLGHLKDKAKSILVISFLLMSLDTFVDLARICMSTSMRKYSFGYSDFANTGVFDSELDEKLKKYNYYWTTNFLDPSTTNVIFLVIEKLLELQCFSYTANKMFSSEARGKELVQILVDNEEAVQKAFDKFLSSRDHKALAKLLNVESKLKMRGFKYLMLTFLLVQVAEMVYRAATSRSIEP